MRDNLKTRPARHADIPALHRLIESAYRGDSARQGWTHEADLLGGQRTDPETLAAIIADPDKVILVAMDDDQATACFQLSRLDENIAYLGLLTVAPHLQTGGFGKQLLERAEEYSRTRWHSTAIEMTVIRQRSELIAYYQRRGYRLTGEHRPFPHGDQRFGLPVTKALEFVVLSKSLAQ